MSDPSSSLPSLPEEVLAHALELAISGDEAGFTSLWRHHNSRLTRYVQSRLFGSAIDAEEIVSETWLHVAKDLRKFSGGIEEFAAWLYTIARNRIIDAVRIRDRQVRPTEEIEEAFWLPSKEDVAGQFEGNEKVREIILAIQQLPSAQSEVLLLRIVSDLSVEETAKVVKKSANSVRVLAHRGLATLKENLGGEHKNG